MSSDRPLIELSIGRRWMVLALIVLGSTIYNAMVLIASTLLPQMQGALSATADEVAWVMTFNILATAVATPMTGWLVQRMGRRDVMVWSMLGFTVATAFCGFAGSLESLVFWRIAQGAFGAPIIPLGQTILLDIFPRRQHAMIISVFGMANMIGPVIGPTLGGVISESFGWRYAFHMCVPFGVLTVIGLWLAMPRDQDAKATPFDWTGFLTLAVAISAAQLVLSRGQRLDWFESSEIIIVTLTGLVALYLFLAHSLTDRKPFLDLRLLTDRNYALGLILVTLFGMLNFTPAVLLPPMLQQLSGFPDTTIGWVVAYRGFGAFAGFFIAMFTQRIDPRIGMIAGFTMQIVCGYWLTTLDFSPNMTSLMGICFLNGIGVGTIWVPMTFAAFATLPADKRPEAMAVYHLMRNIGSSFFIAIAVATMLQTKGISYSRLTEHITPYNEVLTVPGIIGAWTFETLPGLAKIASEINRQAALIGYVNAYLLFTIVCSIAIPLILFVRPHNRGTP